MILTIACAYCHRQILIRLANTTVHGRGAQLGGAVKCEACGSSFTLHVSTKRKSKGKEMRAIEARAQAALDAAVEARRKLNKVIGDELLAQDGCSCAAHLHRYEHRTGSRDDGGHPMSTGFSRDKRYGGMLPTLPRHYHTCPLCGSDRERAVHEAHKEQI